ncbi:hypothetical protein SAMD00019534_032550 [Acytostelium subglobosum LB1]|uniref:hypothetical protein n=1 Tax=Acytostelium subglobosum LB1 TaxID=1410327 RepID=UPI000644CDCF|nr:hypothetical protein SAMD00019534_032550 [Acytostelium subglobosum LB1]GAM20080.1 hypothetical protein SAMD00019534_032550 [Acytostelium subglobosum LB1]|eukprot:XP_012756842.1 hypothetical protein SAMD00019534_032550 [Acytostelium subglobosum LB1]
MIEYKHYGLIRDRIKRGLHINFDHNAVLSICISRNIDQDTFDTVYKRYQSYFDKSNSYYNAIKHDNLVVVKTLFHQTYPVTFERVDLLLKFALLGDGFSVLKYFMDSGLFNNSILWQKVNESDQMYWDKVYRAPPSSIRHILDLGHFPQPLIDHIKSLANQYVFDLMLKGDLQLINDLMFKDGVRLFGGPITSKMLLPFDFPPAEQLAHFQRMLPNSTTATSAETSDVIAKSKERVTKISIPKEYIDHHGLDIGDDARTIFVKLNNLAIDLKGDIRDELGLASYTVSQYIITGDYMLLPHMISTHIKWPPTRFHNTVGDVNELFRLIIIQGNIIQALVSYEILNNMFESLPQDDENRPTPASSFPSNSFYYSLFNNFVKANDMTKSHPIIQYFISKNRNHRPIPKDHEEDYFRGTQSLKYCLMSGSNYHSLCTEMGNVVLQLHHIEQLIRDHPELLGRTNFALMVQVVAFYGRADLLQALIDRAPHNCIKKTIGDKMANDKYSTSRSLDVIKLFGNHRVLKFGTDTNMIKSGLFGDLDMFDYLGVHCQLHGGQEGAKSIVCDHCVGVCHPQSSC